MPKAVKKRGHAEAPRTLKGWQAIGAYLGIGGATAQRWAKGGMPVRREGRFTIADANEIRKWLGREALVLQPVLHCLAGVWAFLPADGGDGCFQSRGDVGVRG